jgi:hypothetical protein
MRVDLGLGKLFTSKKPERSSPAVHLHAKQELRQSAILSFGRIFKSNGLSFINRIACTPGQRATTQSAMCNRGKGAR